MSLFGKIVGVAVEAVKLPVEVAKDVVTLADVGADDGRTHTGRQLDRIKEEARQGDVPDASSDGGAA